MQRQRRTAPSGLPCPGEVTRRPLPNRAGRSRRTRLGETDRQGEPPVDQARVSAKDRGPFLPQGSSSASGNLSHRVRRPRSGRPEAAPQEVEIQRRRRSAAHAVAFLGLEQDISLAIGAAAFDPGPAAVPCSTITLQANRGVSRQARRRRTARDRARCQGRSSFLTHASGRARPLADAAHLGRCRSCPPFPCPFRAIRVGRRRCRRTSLVTADSWRSAISFKIRFPSKPRLIRKV